jgi:hypothetical protein
VDDLAARVSAGEPAVDAGLAPPRLLEDPDQFQVTSARAPALPPGVSREDAEDEWMRAAERAFLDDSVPALDGRTPREAARDLVLRPKLLRLMKQRVRSQDERNLRTGRTEDLNWMLRELDLHELIFDPPPLRPPPAEPTDDDFPEAPDEAPLSVIDSLRPPPPRLPAEPIGSDQAFERLDVGLRAFKTAEEALDEIYASGASIVDDAMELLKDQLSEEEFSFAIPFIIKTWFAFVPPGCRAPEITFLDLEEAYVSNLRKFDAGARSRSEKDLEAFFLSCTQPEMMIVLLGGFMEAAGTVPKELRPDPIAQSMILALLRSLLEILDRELRQG